MIYIKRSYVLNVLIFFCIIVFAAVNSSEDNGKNTKPETQTVNPESILDIVEELENKEEKDDSNPAQNKDEKVEETTEIISIDVKGTIKVKEDLEEGEGTEESVKLDLKETIEGEVEEKVDIEKEPEKEVPKEPVPEVKVETLTTESALHDAKVTTFEKEKAPENTFAVWNSKGKICILARFNATFSITYPSKGGEQKAEIHVPKSGNAKGKCESNTRSPLLQISWGKYVLTLMFNKSDEENWVVTSIEFTYDTTDPLFDRATNAGKKTARSKAMTFFETPVGRSYTCPAKEVVLLYTANKQVVTARFRDVFLHPYLTESDGSLPAHRCNKVVIDGLDETPFVQDETVPLAVGCTLALITLCILIGFSVHRAYNAAKVDYNNME